MVDSLSWKVETATEETRLRKRLRLIATRSVITMGTTVRRVNMMLCGWGERHVLGY